MQDWKQQRSAFAAIASAPTLWLLLFFIIPLAIVWAYSFGSNEGLTSIRISGTFANYARALEPLYLQIFGKSVAVAALTTLICLIVGFPVALAIAFASPRWKPWLLLLIMLPFWTNLLIRTYALLSLLGTRGVINQGAEWFWGMFGLTGLFGPFEPLPLLYNNFAVIFGLVYVHLPFMVLPLYSVMRVIPPSYARAARSLGATSWTTFRRIYLPQTLPGMGAGALLVFILAVGSRSGLLWGLVGLVLLVNLAGALPLAMEWKKLRRKYRDLCSQETT